MIGANAMRTAIFTVALSVLTAVPCAAQVRARPTMADSSVPAIMSHARTGLDNPAILAVLRDAEGRFTRAKQDMIADSLIGRAISNHGRAGVVNDSAAYGAAIRALATLAHAGMSEYAGSDANAGKPYPGAIDGLIRIHRGAPVRQIRARALSLMLRQPNRNRALDYARQTAQLGSDDGYDAAFVLLQEATGLSEFPQPTKAQRDEALVILRELDQKHLVSNPLAAHKLRDWIRSVKP